MENCKWFEQYFSDYIEGQLDLSLTQKLEQHLAKCKYCTAIIQRMRLVMGSLHQVSQLKTSSDFDTILRTRIRIESGLERSSWRDRFNSWAIRIPVYAASIAIILIAFVLLKGQYNPVFYQGSNAPRSIAIRDSNFSDTKHTHYEINSMRIYDEKYFLNPQPDSSAVRPKEYNPSDSVKTSNRISEMNTPSKQNPIQSVSHRTYTF